MASTALAGSAPGSGWQVDGPLDPQLSFDCPALNTAGLQASPTDRTADLPRQLAGTLRVNQVPADHWVQLLALPAELADTQAAPLDQLGAIALGTGQGSLSIGTLEAGAAWLLEGSEVVLQALALNPLTGELNRSAKLRLTPVDAYLFELSERSGGWRSALLGDTPEPIEVELPSELSLVPNSAGVLWREWRGLPPGAEVELHVATRAATGSSQGDPQVEFAGALDSTSIEPVQAAGRWVLGTLDGSSELVWHALEAAPGAANRWHATLGGRANGSGRLWIALRAKSGAAPVRVRFERLALVVRHP